MFVTGKPITEAPDSALIMFARCSNMKWNHLPNAGGLYDQDPRMLKKFDYIFSKQAEHDRKEADKKKSELGAEQRKNNGALGHPSRGR